jgi:site-specific recombinase XerD
MNSLAPQLQAFFSERLRRQKSASPNTIVAYRDTFRLLLRFAETRLGKAASDLDLDDLNAHLLGAFLDSLEKERKNSARTRNARLAAIHSFHSFTSWLRASRVTQHLSSVSWQFPRNAVIAESSTS